MRLTPSTHRKLCEHLSLTTDTIEIAFKIDDHLTTLYLNNFKHFFL